MAAAERGGMPTGRSRLGAIRWPAASLKAVLHSQHRSTLSLVPRLGSDIRPVAIRMVVVCTSALLHLFRSLCLPTGSQADKATLADEWPFFGPGLLQAAWEGQASLCQHSASTLQARNVNPMTVVLERSICDLSDVHGPQTCLLSAGGARRILGGCLLGSGCGMCAVPARQPAALCSRHATATAAQPITAESLSATRISLGGFGVRACQPCCPSAALAGLLHGFPSSSCKLNRHFSIPFCSHQCAGTSSSCRTDSKCFSNKFS